MMNKELTKDELFRWLSGPNKIGGASMEDILNTFTQFSDTETLYRFVKELQEGGLIHKYNGQFWPKNK